MRFIILSFMLFSMAFFSKAQIKISARNNIDFNKYATFTFEKGQISSTLTDRKTSANKVYEVLKQVITSEMTKRGFVSGDSTAQLAITYFFEESVQSDYQKPGPLGQTPVDDPATVDEANRKNVVRTLIIEIEENKNNSSLWTATCPFGNTSKDVYSTLETVAIAALKKIPYKKIKK